MLKMYKIRWQFLTPFDLNFLFFMDTHKSVRFSLYLLLSAASLLFILVKKETGFKDFMFLIQL